MKHYYKIVKIVGMQEIFPLIHDLRIMKELSLCFLLVAFADHCVTCPSEGRQSS